MVGVIDGFRWALLGGNSNLYLPGFMLSIVLVLILLITGVRYFRYGDDLLLIARERSAAAAASQLLEQGLAALKLRSKPSSDWKST